MSNPVLAMAVRALRTGARDRGQFLARGALVLLLLLALWIAVASSGFFGAPGLRFFHSLVLIDLLLLVLLAVSSFATTITEEKEASSLGLLLLAGFRPVSLLLGKSTGPLLATVQLLLVQVPFAVLAAALGGVAPRQIGACYAVLFGYACFLFGLGLLASVQSKRGLTASRATGGIAAALLAVPPLGSLLLAAVAAPGSTEPSVVVARRALAVLQELSPIDATARILATGWSGPLVGTTAVANAALGLALCLAAWLAFRRPVPELDAAAAAKPRTSRKRVRPGLRGRALAWKDFHFLGGGWNGFKIRLAYHGLACIVLAVLVHEPRMNVQQFLHFQGLAMCGLMAAAIALEGGVQCGRTYRTEIEQRTLFGLALLPSRIGTWAFDKARGSLGVILAPACWLAVGLCLVVLGDPYQSPASLAGLAFGGLYAGAAALLLWHLTAILSLQVGKGALPVAIGTFVLVWVFARAMWPYLAPLLGCWAGLLPAWAPSLCVAFADRIARRLRRLAAA